MSQFFQHAKGTRLPAYALLLVACCCLAWGLYASHAALRPDSNIQIKLAAGEAITRRFEIAGYLAEEARSLGVEAEVVETKSFQDSIQQVIDGKVDMALVSSGLPFENSNDIRVLAGLNLEPLHILVRQEFADSGLPLVDALKGKRFCSGEVGTCEHLLFADLLDFLRVSPRDGLGRSYFTSVTMNNKELIQRAEQAQHLTGESRQEKLRELPDVIGVVASLPSRLTQILLDTNEYRLLPLSYANAYLMDNLQSASLKGKGIERLYIEKAAIPAATYFGKLPIPIADCQSIGMRTLVVSRADLPPAVVSRMMQCLFEGDFSRRIPPRGPHEMLSPYAPHAASVAYFERNKPLITGKFFDLAGKALSIFGAFSAGVLTLYGFLRRHRARRPQEYLEEIRYVDLLASGQRQDSEAPSAPNELASYLDNRLLKLKEQLIHDYCNKRVQGEMVLMSILSMLADSRSQLRRSFGQLSDHEAPVMESPDRAPNIPRRRAA